MINWFIRYCCRVGKYDPIPGFMDRWELVRTRWFGVRLHHTLTPDRDRNLHDHPWWNVSFILKGGYIEALPVNAAAPEWVGPTERTVSLMRRSGDLIFRGAKSRHRLAGVVHPCWSLFIVGRHKQAWGFYTREGKVLA